MIKYTKKNPIAETGAIKLNDTQLDAVSGGPDTYIKFDGVDGESQARVPADSFSLNFTKIESGL